MRLRAIKLRRLLMLTISNVVIWTLIKRVLFSPDSRTESRGFPAQENVFSSYTSSLSSSTHEQLLQIQLSPRLSPGGLNKSVSPREYLSHTLSYNEKKFRQAIVPILWLDEKMDVRWNEAAERQMIIYLTYKQFPNYRLLRNSSLDEKTIVNICRARSIFALHQHFSGFFSRVLCFIAQFGQTLYTPRIGILRGTNFIVGRGQDDDFLGQGINRYFPPFSICSAYVHHPQIDQIRTLLEQSMSHLYIARSQDLHSAAGDQADRILFSSEYWKMDYHHVPIRKWLFDRQKSNATYTSSVDVLSNHSNEHIYAPKNPESVFLDEWIDRNRPDAFPSDLLPNEGKYSLTWKDHVFGSFLRYMFVLFFTSQNAPRIEMGQRILADYWSSFLKDKYALPREIDPFNNLAGLYVRRGDKSNEDRFWHKHGHWRNLSYYVRGIVDEEVRRKTFFKSVFVMTDDVSVMHSLMDYANPLSNGTDEPYAREHLKNRDILYNVLAPQACFDPFRRIGFDQFLVSMRFLIENSRLTVGHIDSNVFRFFREVIYARRQRQPGVQSSTYAKNAPDSLYN